MKPHGVRVHRTQTHAKVVIGLDSRPEYLNFIDLLIRNEDIGPVYDVRFEVVMAEVGGDDSVLEAIQSVGFAVRGIECFSPGQEIRSFLTNMTDSFEAKDQDSKPGENFLARKVTVVLYSYQA